MYAPINTNPFSGLYFPSPDAAPGSLDLAKGALDLFSLPGNLVRGTLGAAAKAVDPINPMTGGALANLDNQAAFDETLSRAINTPGASGINPIGGVLGNLPAPFAKFVMGQLFDPLNFVGVGIPGQVVKASKLAKAGLTAEDLASAAAGLGKHPNELLAAFASPTDRLTRGAELLSAVEGKTQDLLLGGLKLPFRGIGKLGEQIPFSREIVGGINPDLTANLRQSNNLTDYATSLSKRAYLKQFEGGLQEALAHYKAAGGDFGEIDPSLVPSDLAAIFNDGVKSGFGHHVRALGRERESLEKMFKDIWASRKGRDFPAAPKPAAGQQPLPGMQAAPTLTPEDATLLTKLSGAKAPLGKFGLLLDDLSIPHDTIGSTVDLLKAVQTHVSDQDWNKFDRIVKAYPAGDILTDHPMDLVLDRVVRDRAKMLGLEEPTGVGKAWQTGTALFNEQALQSISYLLTNALGGVGMGALEGVNPFKVARNLSDNFGSAARGESVFTSGTRDLSTALGLVDEAGNPILPRTVSAEGAGMLGEANSSRLYTGKGLTASQAIGAPALATGGAALGGISGYAQSPDDASSGEVATSVLTGAGVGGLAGGLMPTLSKYILQRFSRGIEDVLRQSAWEHGTRQGVAAQLDPLEQTIRDAYATHPTAATTTPGLDLAATPTGHLVDTLRGMGIEPPTMTTGINQWGPTVEPDWRLLEAMHQHAATGGTVRNPNGRGAEWLQGLLDLAQPRIGPTPPPLNIPADDMVRAMRELDGLFSPDSLTKALRDQAGLSDAAAQTAGRSWRDAIHAASTQGADLSNTINFDYANLNNAEEMVRQVVPFSTWAMKAFPFFGRHIAEHPAILTSALELQRQSREMRDQQGLTNRVQGSLPMGEPMDAVWSAILGRPVDTYTNPLRGLLPFADTAKQLESLDQEENPIAAAYKALTAFGPSAHPALELIARTSGLLGTDTPARGLLRLAGPLQGATAALGVNRGRGVTTDAALTTGEGAVRKALSGREVTDLAQIAAERRVDELALQQTGKTITSGDPTVASFLQAKSARKGPIWDQAMKDTMRERGLRSLIGYVSNQASPSAIVSHDEAQIRQARANLLVPQDLSVQIRALVSTNPGQQIDGETFRAVQQITTQLPQDSGIKPEHIQTVLGMPTAANVNWLFRAIYEYEQEQHPEVSAYSGAGSPEQRQLSSLLGQYRNPAARDPALQNIPADQVRAIQQLTDAYKSLPPGMRGGGATGKLVAAVSSGQDKFRQANPVLDQYLAWLAQRQGHGSPEEFIQETAGRR